MRSGGKRDAAVAANVAIKEKELTIIFNIADSRLKISGLSLSVPFQWINVDTAELFFEDVRLPKSSLLGEENKGFYYLMKELPQERLLIAVMGVSSCEYMFEETRKYLSERKAFGKTLSKLQVIQHKMAELKTEISCTRAFVDQCIELHNEGRLDTSTASMVKYWVSELQNRVAYQCVQLHGGMGYMMECSIARAYVDARVQPIYGGSSEIMKEVIARQIFN
ncbi:hypothetical protein Btru_028652 [Bulinus truncatus]|nr:hypothetical protein Btru_028652 [Bulinus truncatus]